MIPLGIAVLGAWIAASFGFVAGAWWRSLFEEEPGSRQKGKKK